MNVAVTTSTTALTPIAVSAGDREWWAEQAGRSGTDWAGVRGTDWAGVRGTDWAGVLDGAHAVAAVALGEISSMDTFGQLCLEADRKAAARPDDAGTLRARRLLDDGISYERAYGELLRDRSAPEFLVKALMFSLRRGVNELTQPDTLRRLSALDGDQVKQVCRRVQAFQPEIAEPWSTKEVDALISAWRRSR
jgi:hypothetical protein